MRSVKVVKNIFHSMRPSKPDGSGRPVYQQTAAWAGKSLKGRGEILMHRGRRIISLVLCFCMLASIWLGNGGFPFSVLAAQDAALVTNGVGRESDPSTMDTYRDMLDFLTNSRYAGRLWTDKTVFALGCAEYEKKYGRSFADDVLKLTKALDGVDGQIKLDADFLHVFSALGSGQKLSEHVPVDLVLSIDITSSMLSSGAGNGESDTAYRTYWYSNGDEGRGQVVLEHPSWWNCNLKHALNAANDLMKKMREYSEHTRISVVVYWGTGYQMIPLVDGDVMFTGYSIRKDSGGIIEPILHYRVERSGSNEVSNGDYVYDPVSGAHYRYAVGKAPWRDLSSNPHNTDANNPYMNADDAKEGSYLAFTPEEAYDVISKSTSPLKQGTKPASTEADSPSQLGAGTDVEAGIYTAMKAAATVSDVAWILSDGSQVNRIPAVVILGDGNTNHLLVKEGDSDASRTAGDDKKDAEVTISGEWWKILFPQKSAGAGIAGKQGSGDAHDGAAVANFTGALQGAYWKAAIGRTYGRNTNDVMIYTIGVGADPAALNPIGEKNDGSDQNQIPITQFNEWKKNAKNNFTINDVGRNPNDQNKYDQQGADPFALGRIDGTDYVFSPLPAGDPYGIKTQDLDLNYPTRYFRTGTGADMENVSVIFQSLYREITQELFSPVAGSNDLGVDNAVTYKDPVGRYMEVKDVKNMVLFGHIYGLKKTAMYNYSFVSNHRLGEAGTFKDGWYHFDANGKWLGDTQYPDDGEWKSKGLLDKKCYLNGSTENTPEKPWQRLSDGSYWAYFISSINAMKFVPNVATDSIEDLRGGTPAQKAQYDKLANTTYTFYRIDTDDTGQGQQVLTSADRSKLHMNPAYGTDDDIPENVKYDAVKQTHLNTPGVYALSDLRIWVENTGDYSDSMGDTMTDVNYDEALFINLPVNMLPLRTVTIMPREEGEGGGWKYETNLPKEKDAADVTPGCAASASFPFRVFYTVGMSEEVLTADRNIDIAGSISAEYLQQNKIRNESWEVSRGRQINDVEFFSNWYNPENRYTDYVTTNTDYSYGDPVVTYSPSTDNRYYVFQKPLPLYNRALVWVPDTQLTRQENKTLSNTLGKGGLWKIARINEDYSYSPGDAFAGETFSPGNFGGVVLADDLQADITNVSDDGAAQKNNQEAIWKALQRRDISSSDGFPKDQRTIIFLEQDLLKDVTKPAAAKNQEKLQKDPFSSDGYYYMAIEYYEFKEDGTAIPVKYAVTRKGSEFGSAYKAAGIKNGDMLCWYDASGKHTEIYPYLSATDTGDNSRGREYIGLSADELESLRNPDGTYAKLTEGSHRDLLTKHENAMKDAKWVVSAKPGGLRVGALAQAVGEKYGIDENGDRTVTAFHEYEEEYVAQRFHALREQTAPSPDPAPVTGQQWGYYEGNTTRTANNYYLPTISTSSDAGKQDMVVNVYLGNNGRLWTSDTLLLVTKKLETGGTLSEAEKNKLFNFQVTVAGFTGDINAVRIRWNEAAKAWQRQIHYIDMELNQDLFLQNQDGSLVMVDDKGCLVTASSGEDKGGAYDYVYAEDCGADEGASHNKGDPYRPGDSGGPFHVYTGKNGEGTNVRQPEHGFRIYHNSFCETSADKVVSREDVLVKYYGENGDTTDYGGGELPGDATGKRDFYAAKVKLIPASGYAKGSWNAETGLKDAKELANFYLATLDPANGLAKEPENIRAGDIVISSPYRTQSAYLTETVHFGIAGDALYDKTLVQAAPGKESGLDSVEKLAAHTADVSLRTGWGLLFAGMESGTQYRLTEKIPDEVQDDGYFFKSVRHVRQDSDITYEAGHSEFRSQGKNLNYYSVTGDTGEKEEAGHYANTRLGALEVEKEVIDDVKGNKEFEFTVTLSIPAESLGGDPQAFDIGSLSARKKTDGGYEDISLKWEQISGSALDPDKKAPETGEEEPGSGQDTGKELIFRTKVMLRHGEKIIISKIPYGTGYTVAESGRQGYNLQHVYDVSDGEATDSEQKAGAVGKENSSSQGTGRIMSEQDGKRKPGAELDVNREDGSVSGVIKSSDREAVSLLFQNSRAPFLPFSGGTGKGLFIATGMLAILAGGILYRYGSKKAGSKEK